MATVVSREAYFQTGLDVLADQGYGGLKLAEVCGRLGVTTGSFYHYFASWSAFTTELVEHWQNDLTGQRITTLQEEPDPRRRIDRVVAIGLALPHSAEAAIRTWSAIDPKVRTLQEHVDRERFEVIRQAATEILGHPRQAELFAKSMVYILVGYEQSTLPPDTDGLAWISAQLLEALDDGRFSTLPD